MTHAGAPGQRREFRLALLLGALLTLLTVARCPGVVATPQFYAEDGGIFYQQAHDDGFLAALPRPTGGYVNALPRLMAGAALLVPVERAPLVVVLLALLVQMLPVFYLLGSRSGRYLPSFSLRAAAALLYVILPDTQEIFLTGTNAQWHLTPAVVFMLLGWPPRRPLARCADLALLLVFSFTGPAVVLLLPLLPLFVARERREGRGAWATAVAAAVVPGAAVQGFLILTSARIAGGAAEPVTGVTAAQLVRILSTHAFYDVLLGGLRFARLRDSFGLPLHLLGLLVLIGIAAYALRRGPPALRVLGYLAGATVASALLFPTNNLALWLQPTFGPRYYHYAAIFLVAAIGRMLLSRGVERAAGLLLAAPLLLLGVPSDFSRPPWPDTHYRDQIAVWRSLPAGATFYIPTLPDGWGMRLARRPGEALAPSPLAGLRALPQETYARAEPPEVNARLGLVRIRGWALDAPADKPAGGVWLRIDGGLYPATYRRAWSWRREETAGRGRYAFERFFPLADLGQGRHELELIALTYDRTGYYRPGPTGVFDLVRSDPPQAGSSRGPTSAGAGPPR